jgi:hypothetical protein
MAGLKELKTRGKMNVSIAAILASTIVKPNLLYTRFAQKTMRIVEATSNEVIVRFLDTLQWATNAASSS